MTPSRRDDVTRYLLDARSGSAPGQRSRVALFEHLYDELRALAVRRMRGERAGHTLSPTALVHEVFLRLVDESRITGSDRARFMGIAARAMRQVLVDHARTRGAVKRGGRLRRVTLDDGARAVEDPGFDAVALHLALDALAERDERAASVAEMHVFGGVTLTDIATALGVSRRTVNTDWAFARRWLSRAMNGD